MGDLVMILSRQPALSAFSFLPSLSKHPSGEARQTNDVPGRLRLPIQDTHMPELLNDPPDSQIPISKGRKTKDFLGCVL